MRLEWAGTLLREAMGVGSMKSSKEITMNGFVGMDRTRRAKIVATLGPSCSTTPVFRQLVRAGLDVARLNFSHGSHEQKAELIAMVRQVSGEERKPICILPTCRDRRFARVC